MSRLFDPHKIVAALATHRPLFHSEADFQHALAWELHRLHPSAHVRLEKRISSATKRVHLDLLVCMASEEIAIELKYKTRALRCDYAAEAYDLLDQSAQDHGRHDFIKDITRLEHYVSDRPHAIGYAILLTNDQSYWTQSQKQDSVDAAFRLHEGRVVQGQATWDGRAATGTTSGRSEPLLLRGSYPIAWRDYSSLGSGPQSQFRYVTVRVSGNG